MYPSNSKNLQKLDTNSYAIVKETLYKQDPAGEAIAAFRCRGADRYLSGASRGTRRYLFFPS
jgi:hypothetical protein